MNRYLFAVLLAVMALVSCTNHPTDFPDYAEQNVSFPIQYPVRTLVLGEDRLDNGIDREHAFSIGVCIGGMYENKKDWTVDYEVDPALIDGLKANDMNGNEVSLEVLPEYYYTFEPENTVVIPTGSFTGKIRVNLSDAFFDDENSCKVHYVIPLKITSTSASGVLWGTAVEENANIHRASDWSSSAKPRFFTIFGIKYINPLHGTFFHRGSQYKDGSLEKSFTYPEFELGQTAKLCTAGKNKVTYNRMGEFMDGSKYETVLTFGDSENGCGDIQLSAPEDAEYSVKGSGKYYESSTDFAKQNGSWLVDPNTGKKTPHLTVVLDYEVSKLNGSDYHFADTLVFRDNGVVYETFTPILEE